MQHWPDDELRSLNAQIEYVLRGALRKAGRSKPPTITLIVDPIKDNQYTIYEILLHF